MTEGLRERKKSATRQALHRAALQLVAERGLDAVSTDDVAAAAGVSARTFFNYFPTKDDAVLGLDPHGASRAAAAFRARPAEEDPVASLRAVHRDEAVQMSAEPELWPLRLTVIGDTPALAGRLAAAFGADERAVAAAVAERTGSTVDGDALPTLLAAMAHAVMRTSLYRWRATDFTRSLPELVDEAWDLLVTGLPTR